MSAELTTVEVARFAACEAVIERGLKTFVEVGEALREVRDSRLYRQHFATFEDYCRERWDMDRTNAHRHIDAAMKVLAIDNTLPRPSSVGVARELPRDLGAANAVWSEAVAEHGERPTARQVAETRDRLAGAAPPEPDDVQRQIIEQKREQGGEEAAREYADAMGVTLPQAPPVEPALPSNLAPLFSSARDVWSTPQDFFDVLDAEFGFELDVCASADNAKCPTWFDEEVDGLAQPWAGVCWMNPPYSEVARWIEKAAASAAAGATVVALIPARVETRAWWDYCRHHEVRFVRGRLKFGGSPNSAPFPSAVVVFGRPANVIWWEPEEVSSREDLAA